MTTFAPTSSASPAASVSAVSPTEARDRVNQQTAVLIDVREPFERAAAFIPGSHAHPLSRFDARALRLEYPDQTLIFSCKSGSRSADAAQRFLKATGEAGTHQMTGGIEAWQSAGLPVERSANAPKLDVMRQVQIIAGGLVLLGVLGSLIHPAFIGLSVFVGAGLVFAGVSGWCGMAKLLGHLPWNRCGGGASC